MRGNSNCVPVCFGVQSSIIMPFGVYTNTSRTGAFACARARAANAGTIASSHGSATVAPTPLKNVRRGRCLPVMIMALLPAYDLKWRAVDDAHQQRGEPVVIRLH